MDMNYSKFPTTVLFTPPINCIKALIRNDPSVIIGWNQTPEICEEALKWEPRCLPFIREQTKY